LSFLNGNCKTHFGQDIRADRPEKACLFYTIVVEGRGRQEFQLHASTLARFSTAAQAQEAATGRLCKSEGILPKPVEGRVLAQ